MEIFFKIIAFVLLALILVITVGRGEGGISMILSIMACCMVAIAGLRLLRPIMDFLCQLETDGNLPDNGLGTLLKISGIGFVTEIACAVCQDAGNASLAKQLQVFAGIVMLNLSLPFFETLLELIQTVLGEL